MAMSDWELFIHCYEAILFWETPKFTNFKSDLGGATKYGITLSALAHYRRKTTTVEDVRMLTQDEAMKIYYQNFWKANGCHLLPPALALLLFDGCVNQNAAAIRKYMQVALGVKDDGVIGPATALSAAKTNVVAVIVEFMSLRAVRYGKSSTFDIHGHGWFRRMFDMHQRALNLIETKRKEN